MNRSIANVYSSEDKYQGNVYYDYVLGLYDFLERLNKNYPDILIEGCSGGLVEDLMPECFIIHHRYGAVTIRMR